MSDLGSELSASLQGLGSGAVERRVRAVEDLGHVVSRIVDGVVEKFAEPGPARYLIFERLGRFGSLVIDPLEQLLWRCGDADPELRVLCAAALMSLGSRAGIGDLLQAVRADDPHVCLAARVLADAQVQEGAAVIEDALYRCDLAQTAVIECLVVALRRLADPLPGGVRKYLQGVEPAWLRDSLLR
jgi:hypothetical protein